MLRTLLVLGILIPGIFAALANRFAGLLLYLWFGLFRPLEFTWVDLSSLRLSLVVGALFVVPSLLTGTFPNVTHPLSFGAILFLLSALIAQLSAFNAAIGWYWIDFLARLLLVSLLSVTLINTRQRFIAVLAVIAVSFGFHTAKAGLYALMHPGSRFMEGLAGAFIDNNGYALGMAMVLWLLVGKSHNVSRPWMKKALIVAAGPDLDCYRVHVFARGVRSPSGIDACFRQSPASEGPRSRRPRAASLRVAVRALAGGLH